MAKRRYIFYALLFLALGVFDLITSIGSWVIELTTGLVNQGNGFPDDYAGAIIFLLLALLSIFFYFRNKKNPVGKRTDLTFAIMAIIGGVFAITIICVLILAASVSEGFL